MQILITFAPNMPLRHVKQRNFTYPIKSFEQISEDIDIGHYSYIHACEQLGNPPIRKVFEQLQTTEISLQYVGLNTNDVIALTYGLLVGVHRNSRIS
jgi:hypothetical protein